MRFGRRRTLATIGGTVIGTGPSGTAGERVDHHPGTGPLSLTEKSKGQLVAAIPSAVEHQLGRAELFVPLNVLESQQNIDEPTPGEGGLVTFTPVRRRGDVIDLEYTYAVDDAPDLDDGFVASLSSDVLETPREYAVNAHTTAFRSEAIRGQVRPAVLGRLSRRELVETVLATAGLEAL